MARVLIEDRAGARLDIELTTGREEYGLDGERGDAGWHVVAFADGRVYEPAPNLHRENAMPGEFATHDIPANPTRPHVASGLCSCRPVYDYRHDQWVHAHKRGPDAVVSAPEPVADAPSGPTSDEGPIDTAEHGGEA